MMMIPLIDGAGPASSPWRPELVTASSKGWWNSINRKQRPRELIRLLGSKWSEGELLDFYEAYRELGQDWVKVAAGIGGRRTKEMVETLYYMNKAYLSLPEGPATLCGFISIMIDRYNFLEEYEEHGASSIHDAKDGDNAQRTDCALSKGSKRGASPQVSQTFSRRVKRVRFKLGGKVLETTQERSDTTKRYIGLKIPSDGVRLYDKDPEALRKHYFGDDERIPLVCEALLELSMGKPRNIVLTGESSEAVARRRHNHGC